MVQYFHICNPTTPEPSDCKNIVSIKELNLIKEDRNLIYLLHIHLNWEGNKLSSNYGFDIANIIRTEIKSKAPIIFYSPIQKKYFEEKSKKEAKYKILFGRGSDFIPMPFTKEDLEDVETKIKPLSNAALHDVVTMLCDLKGIVIDKLNHDLKFNADIKKVIESIAPYLTAIQKQSIKLNDFTEKFVSAVNHNDSSVFLTEKKQFINLCIDQLTEVGKESSDIDRVRHKILILDDVENEVERAKAILTKDFEVIGVNEAKEAIEILTNDISNEILAVISDWRLFTDKNQNYWQSLQGYEVLEFAAKNGVRSLFALTSQADFLIHQIRNLQGIRFALFKKENLEKPEQWNLFSDVLYEGCLQAVDTRGSLNAAQWTKVIVKNGETLKTLKQQYIEVWNSDERDNYFSKITSVANDMWDYLLKNTNNNALNIVFGITIPTKVLELEPILIYRRIWLALWFNKTDIGKNLSKETISKYSEDIYKRMFAPGIRREMYNSGSQNAFKLCIEINQIQKGNFLPEEKEWLINHNLLDNLG